MALWVIRNAIEIINMRKISVRNIPEEIYAALEALANVNLRSVEAQVRYCIQQCVQSEEDKKTGSELYRADISKRLIKLLNDANKINKKYSKLEPTHIAEEMNYENVGTVTDWFSGDVLPSLSELKELSKIFGCSSNWLIHGDLPVYPQRAGVDLHTYGRYAVRELSTPDEQGNKVKAIHLVREDDETGSLLIIREFEGTRNVDHFWPGIHISEANGSGGEAKLAAFFVTLRALYKAPGNMPWSKGYIMQKGLYEELCEEKQQHPLTILKTSRTKESVWWEDIWDKNQNSRHKEYWKGERLIATKTQRHVNSTPNLITEIEAIKKRLPLED